MTAGTRRFQCFMMGCAEWHDGHHVVDGLEVLSAYCELHATYDHRFMWMLDKPEDDPRPLELRYQPAAVPTSRFYDALEARAARTDLLPPPEPAEGIWEWTDLRGGMIELPPTERKP